MKIVFKEVEKFKKGKIYDTSAYNIPKEENATYFDNSGKHDFHPDFESFSAQECIKSFELTVIIKEYFLIRDAAVTLKTR